MCSAKPEPLTLAYSPARSAVQARHSVSPVRDSRGALVCRLAAGGVVSGVTGRTRMRFPSVSRRQIGSSTTAGRYRDFEHRVSPRSSSQNEIVPAASALREISPRYPQRLPSFALFACPAILSASPPFAAGLRKIGRCGDSQAISQMTHKAAFELSPFPILERLYSAKLPVICGQSIVVS